METGGGHLSSGASGSRGAVCSLWGRRRGGEATCRNNEGLVLGWRRVLLLPLLGETVVMFPLVSEGRGFDQAPRAAFGRSRLNLHNPPFPESKNKRAALRRLPSDLRWVQIGGSCVELREPERFLPQDQGLDGLPPPPSPVWRLRSQMI